MLSQLAAPLLVFKIAPAQPNAIPVWSSINWVERIYPDVRWLEKFQVIPPDVELNISCNASFDSLPPAAMICVREGTATE